MSNPIVKRFCICLEGRLLSPLLAGSGKDEDTDGDVLMDVRGRPYLPGSSAAGASLHYLSKTYPDRSAALKLLFGSRDGYRSRLYFYHTDLFVRDQNGEPTEEPPALSVRDGVKLDEFKTAEERAKYVLQIVEAGTSFRMRLEWILREDSIRHEEQEEALLCLLLDGIARGELTFGAKSRRGFGRFALDAVKVSVFRHTPDHQEDSLRWLNWDWKVNEFDTTMSWIPGQSRLRRDAEEENEALAVLRKAGEWQEFRIPLAVRQTLMIRQYLLPLSAEADYAQLTSGEEGPAVIPGTSWTGAIRRHIQGIIEEISEDAGFAAERVSRLFGSQTDGAKENRKRLRASLLRVEESKIEGGSALSATRTAIDRFTGGVKSGALFTTRPWAGGKTELVIRWLKPGGEDACGLSSGVAGSLSNEVICGLLFWVARDLQDGFLPVGGETAVGRGVMAEAGDIRLNGEVVTPELEARCLRAAAEWCKRRPQEVGCDGTGGSL